LAGSDDLLRDRLSPWPVSRPRDWIERVNRPHTERELEALRLSVARGQPFGAEAWQMRTAKTLGLESTFRGRGRPRKEPEEDGAK
jgi:putative transposase